MPNIGCSERVTSVRRHKHWFIKMPALQALKDFRTPKSAFLQFIGLFTKQV